MNALEFMRELARDGLPGTASAASFGFRRGCFPGIVPTGGGWTLTPPRGGAPSLIEDVEVEEVGVEEGTGGGGVAGGGCEGIEGEDVEAEAPGRLFLAGG